MKHTTIFIGICALLITLALPVHAQKRSNSNNNYVTLYEDCDFRGVSRTVPFGQYSDMRDLGMKNDRLSSMRIPRGMEVTLYQHERFDGFSSSFDRDVRCLSSDWDDQTSSLRIDDANRSNNRSNGGRGNYTENGVNGNNVSRVDFADTVLEKSGSKEWQISNRNGETTTFRELSKTDNAVYLEANRKRQKLRVDLFTMDVTIVSVSGQQASYPIDRALRANDQYRPITRPNTHQQNNSSVRTEVPNRGPNVVRGRCFNYTAYTNGGDGGVRFADHEGFVRFDSKPRQGKICHNGSLKFEINKRQDESDVSIEIQGVRYRFAPNEQATQLLNNWYRKEVTIIVKR